MCAQRDYNVDILKFIGTLLVLLAHTSISGLLFELRTFDVIMLVFASGLTLKYHGENFNSYILYIWKRIKRLLFPSWIFISFLFVLDWVLSFFGRGVLSYDLSYVINSYLFIGGIKPFWIIRVYLTIAIVSPLIIKISDSNLIKEKRLIFVTGLLLVNDILGFYFDANTGLLYDIFKALIAYTLGYSIVVFIAKSFEKNEPKNVHIVSFLLALTTVFWILSGFLTPNSLKYPPRSLYISYGCLVSSIVYFVLLKCELTERCIYKNKYKRKQVSLGGGV